MLMLTRVEYIKHGEKWHNTIEEAELIKFVIDDLNNPEKAYNFAPVIVDINGKKWDNNCAKALDLKFVELNQKVLKKYLSLKEGTKK